MEEDVKPEDEDGVDGWGVGGWDVWVCGLGEVSTSLSFGLVRWSGVFVEVLPSSPLVSRYRSRSITVPSATSSVQVFFAT